MRGANMKEICKHFRIWTRLFRINLMSQLEYRANFATGLMMEGGYLFAKIMYVIVVYAAGTEADFRPYKLTRPVSGATLTNSHCCVCEALLKLGKF